MAGHMKNGGKNRASLTPDKVTGATNEEKR